MAHLITTDNLGAWLIKCNPESNPGLLEQIDRPGSRVTTWCVADNYRSAMMRPGDRAILWISGNGRRVARGIWGVGRVSGSLEHRRVDGRSEAGGAIVLSIPLDIPLLPRGGEVSSDELVVAGVTDLEVQVTPAMSNPSWVTKEQLARMEALLDTAPRSSGTDRSTSG